MLDKNTAKKLAKELKIDLFTIYREYLQLLFLKYFYAKSESEKTFFKGGTAIRLLLGSFRFSEDLDFTCLLTPQSLNDLVEGAIRDMCTEVEGVSFKRLESVANSFTCKIFQRLEEFSFPLTIRLDFSLREKPIFTDTSYIGSIFPIGPYPQVTCLKDKEMLAEKIRALAIRGRGRDIFDLWYLLTKRIGIDWELVNKKMLFYKEEINLAELITIIEKMPLKHIKSDLTRFLPISHRDLVNKMQELTIKKLSE